MEKRKRSSTGCSGYFDMAYEYFSTRETKPAGKNRWRGGNYTLVQCHPPLRGGKIKTWWKVEFVQRGDCAVGRENIQVPDLED